MWLDGGLLHKVAFDDLLPLPRKKKKKGSR